MFETNFLKKTSSHKLITIIVLMFFFNTGIFSWFNKFKNYIQAESQQSSVAREVNLIKAYEELKSNIIDCNSILSYEHEFFESFLSHKIKGEVIDVWIIPPFKLDNFLLSYHKKKSLNCIAVSHSLEKDFGLATNVKIRYLNHILPFEKWLIKNGAKTISIKNYGKIIKLN